jgi:hypothetical protein
MLGIKYIEHLDVTQKLQPIVIGLIFSTITNNPIFVTTLRPIGCGLSSPICYTCWLGCPIATNEGACWKSHIAWVLRRCVIYNGGGKP